MRTRNLLAVLIAVLLVGSLAACSKSNEGGTSASGTESSQEGGTLDDLPNAGDLSDAERVLDNFLGEGCARAASYYALVGLSGLAAIGGLTEQQASEYRSTLEELRSGLPSELAGDIQVVSDAYNEFFTAVGSSGVNIFNPSPQVEAAQQRLDSPEVKAANDNITKWLEDNCRG